MSEGQIPVGTGDLPIERATLDDSKVYLGRLERIALSPKTDKNGNVYCSVQVEVMEGDYEGETVTRNYLPLPVAMSLDMSRGQLIKAKNLGVDFERFCRAYKIKSAMPEVIPTDGDSAAKWQEWANSFVGNVGKFTIENSEFGGRMRSAVRDFVF